jgi:hypothetical protein
VHLTMLHTALLPELSLLLYCHAVWLYRRKCNSIHCHNKNAALLTLPNSIIAGFNMHNWKINAKIKRRSLFTLENKQLLPSRQYVAQKKCVPTFGQIRRDLRETRTKYYFGTSKKYSFYCICFHKFTLFWRFYKQTVTSNYT